MSLSVAGWVTIVSRSGTMGGGRCLRGILGGGLRPSFLTMRPAACKTRSRSEARASLSVWRCSSVSLSSSSESSNDKYSVSESSELSLSSTVSSGGFGPSLGVAGVDSSGFGVAGIARSRLESERVYHLFEAYTGK